MLLYPYILSVIDTYAHKIHTMKVETFIMPKDNQDPAKKSNVIHGETIITQSTRSKASLLPKRTSAGIRSGKTSSAKQPNDFGSQPIDFSKFIFMPEGYEKFFIALYLLLIPYLTGLIFLFFFVARTNIVNFTTLDFSTFLIVWAIGYEIVGTIILLLIFYSAFNFKNRAVPQTRQKRKTRGNSAFPEVHKLS